MKNKKKSKVIYCISKGYLVKNLIKFWIIYRDFLRKWQGQKDSNSQPSVLETAVLPLELCPCGIALVLSTNCPSL